jgi:hypothetical protein
MRCRRYSDIQRQGTSVFFLFGCHPTNCKRIANATWRKKPEHDEIVPIKISTRRDSNSQLQARQWSQFLVDQLTRKTLHRIFPRAFPDFRSFQRRLKLFLNLKVEIALERRGVSCIESDGIVIVGKRRPRIKDVVDAESELGPT